jgi:hypothetical protein
MKPETTDSQDSNRSDAELFIVLKRKRCHPQTLMSSSHNCSGAANGVGPAGERPQWQLCFAV